MSGAQQKDSEIRQLGILGDPIGHTLSPLIHQSFGEKCGIPVSYLPHRVVSARLADAVRGAHALGIRGLNITVPHKSAVIAHLSSIDPAAERIGAVNTLVYEADGYRGYNTDISGLKRALETAGIALRDAHVIILGAGGAGRAIAFLCADEGAAEVLLLNRTQDKAAALAAEICEKCSVSTVRAVSLEAFLAAGENAAKYLAIQCTSVGLAPDTDASAVTDRAFFSRLYYAVDIVYRPFQTKFLALAREAGVPCQNGLPMLLYQAADAFGLWFPDSRLTDRDLRDVMHRLMEALGLQSLALVGFMGCGKTTVAHHLAQILGHDVWDTDAMIEEACGKSIQEIFRDEGETLFRDLETGTLRRICDAVSVSGTEGPAGSSAEGVVLSAGGGLPVREENRELLRRSPFRVIWLRVRAETVLERLANDGTRPLLAGEPGEKMARIKALLAERAGVYEDCADLTVDTDGKSPRQIVCEILSRLA